MRIPNLKLKKGFTLIEILVVISIIGTLAGITTFSLTSAKGKGFDSRRKADLKAIETAAVAYYHDHGFYPPDPTAYGGTAFSSTTGGNWIPGLESYINSTPKDPKQAGLLYLLASTIKNGAQTGERLVAGLFTKPQQKAGAPANPQIAGATSVTITANTTDGHTQYGSATYPPDPSGSCSVISTTMTSNQIGQMRSTLSGNYYKWRSYTSFDTSAIPAGSTINSVTLTQNLVSKVNVATNFNLLALNYNWSPTVDCTRWGGSPPTATQVGSFATTGLPANGANFSMTITNSAVAIGGTTYLMLASDRETGNITPSGNEYLSLGTAEAASPPQLIVNYTPPVTPSLVGYWKLDELSGATASDSSGNANTGTINGTWTPTWTTGKYNNGLNFDGGLGHYVNVPDSASLGVTGPFTISAWVKPTVVSGSHQPLIVKDLNGTAYFILFIHATDSKAYFGIKNGTNVSTSTISPLTAGNWVYLTGIYDGTNINIYLNGVWQSSTASNPPPSVANALQFGDSTNSFWGQYNGVLDEVRMYNYAITTAQITTDMNNGVPPGTDNATFISQTAPPATMTAGQTANVSVTMQNNGTTTWIAGSGAGPNVYKLGSQNPQDNNNWGVTNRILLTSNVAPGGQYTFNFTITAPTTAGTYNFQWRMVNEGVAWFGGLSTNIAVIVTAPTPTPTPTSSPTPTPTPTPAPTPTSTPAPTPIPGAATCPNTAFSYCYMVATDRSSFVIWAQLDNTSDPQAVTGSSATCKLIPPAGSPFNYCLDSSTL